MGKVMRRIAIAGIVLGMAWLLASVGGFSLETCKNIQNRMGDLEASLRQN